MATIGEQIREARKRKGLTQEALAADLHMSRQGISHWEQGRTIPDAEMLLRLSSVLEYSFEEQRPVPAEPAPPAVQPAYPVPPASPLQSPVPEAPMPAAAQAPQQDEPAFPPPAELPLQPAEAPAAKASAKRTRWWLAAAAVLLAAVLLLALLLPKPPAKPPKLTLAFVEEEIRLLHIPSYFQGHGYGWLFTLSVLNESDVPLKPERASVIYYTEERINGKSFLSYEEMRPWMDDDLLHNIDSPLHLYFGCNELSSTKVECILHASDPDGNLHIYSISAPLLPAES